MGCDVVIAKTQSGSPPPLTGEGRGGGASNMVVNDSRKTELFLAHIRVQFSG